MRHALFFLLMSALLLLPDLALAKEFEVVTSSWVGGEGEDSLRAARIQSDGTIVVGGVLTTLPVASSVKTLEGANEESAGVLLRLSPDGQQVVSITRVGERVLDFELDAKGQIAVALGDQGVVMLDAAAERVLWRAEGIGYVHRVSVGSDGAVAALVPSNINGADSDAGRGMLYLWDAQGQALTEFQGWRNTQDVCLDSTTRTVVLVGWRQANSFDGNTTNPVQIAYLRGVGFDGETKWTGYDWSTDREADDFLNRPENNMADTRGYRCSIGEDGKLYAAFESAGGNHIFRYSPFDITQKVEIVGGDKYHEWFNSRAEHKLFFARFEPDTGEYLLGQQFAGRISSGRTNTVRAKEGEIVADAQGRVALTSAAASSLPIDDAAMYPNTGSYKGGAYLLVMSADFTERLHINRVSPDATGHAVAMRALSADGPPNIVQVGSTKSKDAMHQVKPWQERYGGGETDAFIAVFTGTIPEGWDPSLTPDPDPDPGLDPAPGLDPDPGLDPAPGLDMDPALQDMGDDMRDPIALDEDRSETPGVSQEAQEGCGCTTSAATSSWPLALTLGLFGAFGRLIRRRRAGQR